MNFKRFLQILTFYSVANILVSVSGSKGKIICDSDDDCINNYTPNFGIAQSYNSSVVVGPFCTNNRTGSNSSVLININGTVLININGSGIINNYGICTCGKSCKSRSTSKATGTAFYYCGPCGRLGSECYEGQECTYQSSECINGYCECYKQGTFFDLYYCYIPYHGYEVALQMAVATCIIIAVCLILVSIYNAIGVHRLRRIQTLRALLRRDNGNRRTGPEDAPPKYDDVVEDLPTYQDALSMDQNSPEQNGVNNLAFENDELDSNNPDLKVTKPTEDSLKDEESKEENQQFTSVDLLEDKSGCLEEDVSNGDELSLNHSF